MRKITYFSYWWYSPLNIALENLWLVSIVDALVIFIQIWIRSGFVSRILNVNLENENYQCSYLNENIMLKKYFFQYARFSKYQYVLPKKSSDSYRHIQTNETEIFPLLFSNRFSCLVTIVSSIVDFCLWVILKYLRNDFSSLLACVCWYEFQRFVSKIKH